LCSFLYIATAKTGFSTLAAIRLSDIVNITCKGVDEKSSATTAMRRNTDDRDGEMVGKKDKEKTKPEREAQTRKRLPSLRLFLQKKVIQFKKISTEGYLSLL
tara:strand:- start:11 stop:316 length:306 start_codon:yes stop_codon:yes gene_type:complete